MNGTLQSQLARFQAESGVGESQPTIIAQPEPAPVPQPTVVVTKTIRVMQCELCGKTRSLNDMVEVKGEFQRTVRTTYSNTQYKQLSVPQSMHFWACRGGCKS